jgi:hypothetical protein
MPHTVSLLLIKSFRAKQLGTKQYINQTAVQNYNEMDRLYANVTRSATRFCLPPNRQWRAVLRLCPMEQPICDPYAPPPRRRAAQWHPGGGHSRRTPMNVGEFALMFAHELAQRPKTTAAPPILAASAGAARAVQPVQ